MAAYRHWPELAIAASAGVPALRPRMTAAAQPGEAEPRWQRLAIATPPMKPLPAAGPGGVSAHRRRPSGGWLQPARTTAPQMPW
jgi:hypothetical protein